MGSGIIATAMSTVGLDNHNVRDTLVRTSCLEYAERCKNAARKLSRIQELNRIQDLISNKCGNIIMDINPNTGGRKDREKVLEESMQYQCGKDLDTMCDGWFDWKIKHAAQDEANSMLYPPLEKL